MFSYRLRMASRRLLGRRKKRTLCITMCIVCMACLSCFLLISSFTLPETAEQMARVEVKNTLSQCINTAIERYLAENNGTRLYTTSRDPEGNITSVTLNSQEANELKTKLARYTREEIEKKRSRLRIPAADLLGSILFSGKGGYIKVNILSSSYVESEIISSFYSSGINQTMHEVSVRVRVGATSKVGRTYFDTAAEGDAVLSQTLIVGKIPDTYAELGTYDEQTRTWLDSYRAK